MRRRVSCFVRRGAEVYLTDVLADEGKETAERLGATFIEHDVTDTAVWNSIVKDIKVKHGRL